MGIVLTNQGKLEEAIEAITKLSHSSLTMQRLIINWVLLSKIKESEEAIEAYNKALALKPDFAEAYNNLGIAFKERGKKKP